jgi:phosphate-selective porin OprO/OprP
MGRRHQTGWMPAALLLAWPWPATAQRPADAPPPDWEARLRAVEERNRALSDQYETILRREAEGRAEAEARYRALEQRYEALLERLEARPAELPPALPESGDTTADSTTAGSEAFSGPSWASETPERRAPRLGGRFEDGFLFTTDDDELQLRFHVLDQTDFKVFSPNDLSPTRSGLYIPRVRFYFEGRLTRGFEYEVSLQRSVEGVWDLLDGNINLRPADSFQVQFGRMLVPYSFDWYDHLEQFFLTPERGLFPLNFGISRSAGLKWHGFLFEDRLQYAVGGYDGRLEGIADNNTTRDAVGYLNWRPFLRDDAPEGLKYLNIGVSGFLGQQVSPRNPLPLRTSLQTSDNDEAAQAATIQFLRFREDTYALGGRSAAAVHLSWYRGGTTLETEFQAGRFGFVRADAAESVRVTVPVAGYHVGLGQFLTGETITRRTVVEPLRPFAPWNGQHGPGAVELFGRFSQLVLGPEVFEASLANENNWTRNAAITDIGLNWYPNRFIKIYLDWQHAYFADPVLLNPNSGLRARGNDLFWIRAQLWF